MASLQRGRPLAIFVHSASHCLTDHESFGDGLICFSLLNGLAERGHEVYAYTNRAAIRQCSPRLQVKEESSHVPANSLAPWEHSWRAERWLKQLAGTRPIDLVWRMHPYGAACPYPPRTFGRPLVVGPLFYPWPDAPSLRSRTGRPRFGVGIGGLVAPAAEQGWQRTLRRASLLLCATPGHAEVAKEEFPGARVMQLPVIVDPLPAGEPPARRARKHSEPLRLAFVANLVRHKNPELFCETVSLLRDAGIPAEGVIYGEGPERLPLEKYCRSRGLCDTICFKGQVPNPQVYAHLRRADLLVSTSRGEPYGRSIAEAMSVGTPGVCHRSGGPAEYIEDAVDGLLIEALNAGNLADAIARVYRDPDLWNVLSMNATAKAAHWTGERVLSRLEEHLLRISRGWGVNEMRVGITDR